MNLIAIRTSEISHSKHMIQRLSYLRKVLVADIICHPSTYLKDKMLPHLHDYAVKAYQKICNASKFRIYV